MSGVNENSLGHHLIGTSLGLKGSWKGLYYDVFVGKPLRKPDGFHTSERVAGFQLSYSF